MRVFDYLYLLLKLTWEHMSKYWFFIEMVDASHYFIFKPIPFIGRLGPSLVKLALDPLRALIVLADD